jgi:hypothetical protein
VKKDAKPSKGERERGTEDDAEGAQEARRRCAVRILGFRPHSHATCPTGHLYPYENRFHYHIRVHRGVWRFFLLREPLGSVRFY